MEFAERLRQLRESAGLTQLELAGKINLKSSAVSKYEKGNTLPTIDTLIKLANIFAVSNDYLLGVSDIPNPYTPENFTSKEINLILRFRKLSADNQIRIDERINLGLEQQEK